MKKALLSTLLLGLSFLGFAQDVDITFHVNMNNQTVDPGGVFLAGGSGFGVPGDNQLTDTDGDGIYSITITKPENFSSHYIFLNGNCGDWSCKEQIGGQPCADPNNFNDRFISVGVNDTTVTTCFNVCSDDTTCSIAGDSVNITINVNMNNEVVDPTGVYLAGGGNFGSPGDNEMTDPDGDGVYSITVSKLAGFTSFYTFLNGNCADWSCKEDISGQACADPNNFNDRYMAIGSNDTTINTCFAVCSNDTSCSSAPVPVNVTFRVDMNMETVDSSGVFMGANFDGWSGGIQMMDGDGDGVYEYTTMLNPNANYEWKFINGANWAMDESFDPATDDSLCTITTDGFTNRFLMLGETDTVLTAYVFNSCTESTVGINDLLVDKNLFSIQPNRTKDRTNLVFTTMVPENRQIEVIDISGRKMLAKEIAGSELRHSLQLGNLAPGMYFVMVRQETKVGMQKLIIMN